MRQTKIRLTAAAAAMAAVLAWSVPAAGQIPAHPRDLKYATLTFDPPDAAKHRRVLKNKVVAYMVEDHELPLVTVTVIVRAGSYLDPAEKVGLAAAVGSQMRAGGAGTLTAEQFDEEADFLAATLGMNLGGTSGGASANFLAKDTDKALDLLFTMLQKPAFQADRFDLYKRQTLQNLARRNDNTAGIEAREWMRLMHGADHYTTRPVTKGGVEGMSRDDLVAFHTKHVHPGNFIIAVSGDFKADEMAAKLEQRMAGWAPPAGFKPVPVPKPAFTPVPGVYVVNKPEVNQGRVTMGHLAITRDNPDEIAASLMNDILGGSGFTSRITNRVRSDEGLAYSAGSQFEAGVYFPGTFRAAFQSKSATVAQAIQIVLEEIERIRSTPVSAEELETVKNFAIEVFPRAFSSAAVTASLFASDELTGRPAGYWKTYRDKVRAVTVADIQRMAQKYLAPDTLAILAVGHVSDMLKGNADKPQYSFDAIRKGKAVVTIPLPDPNTMVYPK